MLCTACTHPPLLFPGPRRVISTMRSSGDGSGAISSADGGMVTGVVGLGLLWTRASRAKLSSAARLGQLPVPRSEQKLLQ